MIDAEDLPPSTTHDPVAVILPHLRDGEDVVRCAAARALAALGSEEAAAALVDALLDEDPDVRTDAMAALVRCARPQDADAIRRSLMGDPVKEVKALAVQALARLADGGSVPLLRSLAKDRCDHDVAWEDGAGMWDDWLEVQLAAIAALGQMGRGDAVEDLLEARADEMGQELDGAVFAALAQIPDGGVAVLLGLLQDEAVSVRAQAFRALSKAQGDVLAPLSDRFVGDASPDIRQLAIGCLGVDDPAVARLALSDPDAAVRRAALTAFAPSRPDIALVALADEDEAARAIALESVASGQALRATADLAENVQVWMATAGGRLAACCAAVLPKIPGAKAQEPLCKVATDTGRPQEARVAALQSLGGLASEGVIETLRNTAMDPIRQVRAAALAALAEISKSADEAFQQPARDALIAALGGGLLDPGAKLLVAESGQESLSEASKVEDEASRRIRISQDGEIVPSEESPVPAGDAGGPESNVIEGHFPKSTLAAIQAPVMALSEGADTSDSDEADDLPAGKTGRRRRRVAVDGPDEIGADLCLIALSVAADCPGDGIEQALAEALDMETASLRVAAFKAIAQRSETMALSPGVISIVAQALGDPDPVIRGYAARALGSCSPKAADQLVALLDDPDAIVRATALKVVAASAPDRALAGLRDDSLLVRRAALESLLDDGTAADLERGMRTCLDEGRTDSLIEACKRSAEARSILLSVLGAPDPGRHQAQAALEAIASA